MVGGQTDEQDRTDVAIILKGKGMAKDGGTRFVVTRERLSLEKVDRGKLRADQV